MDVVQGQEPLAAREANLAGSSFTKCKPSGVVFEDVNMAGGRFHDVSLALLLSSVP